MAESIIKCPFCNAKLTTEEDLKNLFGRNIECPYCQKKFTLLHSDLLSGQHDSDNSKYDVQDEEIIKNPPVPSENSPDMSHYYCYFCEKEYEDLKENDGKTRICPYCGQSIYVEKTMSIFLSENHFQVDNKCFTRSKILLIDQEHKKLLFIPNKKFEVTLDMVTKKKLNTIFYAQKGIFVPFSKIIDWEILTNTSSRITGDGTIDGRMKQSIVGTVIAGPVGTVIGAAGERKIHMQQNMETTNTYDLIISLNDINMNSISLNSLAASGLSQVLSILKFAKFNSIQDDSIIVTKSLPVLYHERMNQYKELEKAWNSSDAGCMYVIVGIFIAILFIVILVIANA